MASHGHTLCLDRRRCVRRDIAIAPCASRAGARRGTARADVRSRSASVHRTPALPSRQAMPRPSRFVLHAVVVTAVTTASCMHTRSDWRTASREPVGLAPDPAEVKEAVVQVYGARTVGAKGLFGVHTWVAVKPAAAEEWTVYEVVGWRLRSSESAMVVHSRPPDARWLGAAPELYADRLGPGVDELIKRIDKAARAYPYGAEYRAWPGPNSNTFTAWIARAVPELKVDLPATAIGKDYLGSSIVGAAPSGSGYQLSLAGVLGLAVSGVDGVEFNVLGLNFGASANGVKLPMLGRIGSSSERTIRAPASPSNASVSGGEL